MNFTCCRERERERGQRGQRHDVTARPRARCGGCASQGTSDRLDSPGLADSPCARDLVGGHLCRRQHGSLNDRKQETCERVTDDSMCSCHCTRHGVSSKQSLRSRTRWTTLERRRSVNTPNDSNPLVLVSVATSLSCCSKMGRKSVSERTLLIIQKDLMANSVRRVATCHDRRLGL